VSLTATNAGGSNTTVTPIGYITVSNPANFTADVTSGIAWDINNDVYSPLAVQFTDTSVGATSWQWNFGDGTANSTVQDPVHSFANAWSYNVTLTVTTPGGSFTVEKYNYINVLLPVFGNVANQLNLSLADLMNSSLYPQVTISNHTYGHGGVFSQMWATGASLNAILNNSSIISGSSSVTFYGSDGTSASVPISHGAGNIRSDNQSMIAYQWYSNGDSSDGGYNQTERDIMPSQVYGQYWEYDLVGVEVW
jgi:PKD repeat protein